MEKGRGNVRQLNSRPNVMVCLAAVLLLFVGISTYYVTGLYAKYTTNKSGTDGARVASFEVHAIEDKNDQYRDLSMDLGEAEPIAIFALITENKSEVAVRCRVDVKFSNVLLDGINVSLSNDHKVDALDAVFTISTDRKSASLVDAMDMSAGSSSTTYIIFTPSANTYSALGDGQSYSSTNRMIVDVDFEQID